ncbi:MAG: hypothetical protein CME60_03370 [Halobacteriovoraceae bacterium]|nr:hypothetical protein [Halobacteriovoraceae bacterium]|tara:strand:- start:386 stop:883 length:498 start_codon:yes stop_codon:yes gene_type:complete
MMNVKNTLKALTIVSATALTAQVFAGHHESYNKAGAMDETKPEQREATTVTQDPAAPTASDTMERSRMARQDEAMNQNVERSNKKLSQLSKNEKIKRVQQALQAEGYAITSVDGIMGPQTKSALKKFQADNGLEESGRLNEKTISAMDLKFDEASNQETDSYYSE